MKNLEEKENNIEILNKEAIELFLSNIRFPMYFLDFEAISNNKQWMFKNGFSLDQQISSFSILRIDSINDDETKVKHFNFINKDKNYKLMSKSLTDFYKTNNAPVVVWGRDLEIKSIAKLIKESPNSENKKLAFMLANIIDIQQLFQSHSFIKLNNHKKISLSTIAKEYDVYEEAKIKNGKNAHYLLEYEATNELTKSYKENISKRIEKYNNSDVINIKRIMLKIIEDINYIF